jgi:5-methylcytosine-specific restriction endonuclease McrA
MKNIKVKPSVTRLQQSGYQKKLRCDRCGHTSRHHQIFVIYYKDGKMSNVNRNNLQTVCSNCNIELSLGLPWINNKITADF